MANVALYSKGTTNFDNQGLGILYDAVSSFSTESAADNGNITYTLELVYPLKGKFASQIVEGNLIRAQVGSDSTKFMIFEIDNTVKDDDGESITAYANAWPYKVLRMSFENGGTFGQYANIQAALDAAKSQIYQFPNNFQLISGIGTAVNLSGKTSDTDPNTIYDDMASFLDALVDASGAQVEYGYNYIRLYSQRGNDISDLVLRDDSNASEVKVTVDYSSIVTRVIPVLPVLDADGNSTSETKIGTPVMSSIPYQYIDTISAKVIQFDTQALANGYFTRTNADRPSTTVDVTPLMTDDKMAGINLFDRIPFYSSKINFNSKLKVTVRVFDNLAGRISSFSLGSSAVDVFSSIQTDASKLYQAITNVGSQVISANGKNTNYYGTIQPTNPIGGDKWYKDIGGGDTEEYIYVNGEWKFVMSTASFKQLEQSINDSYADLKDYASEADLDLAGSISDASSVASAASSAASAAAASAVSAYNTGSQAAKDASAAAASAVTAYNTGSQAAKDATSAADSASAAMKAAGLASSAASDVALDVSGFHATFDNYSSAADNKFTSIEASVAINSDGVKAAAKQSDLDTATGRISDVEQSVEVNTSDITLRALKTDLDPITSSLQTAQSDIIINSNAIKQTVTQSDYDQLTGSLQSQINTVTDTANGHTQTIGQLQTQVNSLGQNNLVQNSEYNPDIGGWQLANSSYWSDNNYYISTASASSVGSYTFAFQNGSGVAIDTMGKLFRSAFIPTSSGLIYSLGYKLSMNTLGTGNSGVSGVVEMEYFDANFNQIAYGQYTGYNTVFGFRRDYKNNFTVPTVSGNTVAYMAVSAYVKGPNAKMYIGQIMLSQTASIGAYVAGTYAGQTSAQQGAFSTLNQSVTQLSAFVTDGNGNISSTFMSAFLNTNFMAGLDGNQSLKSQTDTEISNTIKDPNGYIATNYLTSSSFNQTISQLQTQVNSLGQVNQVVNSEFNPDLSGWSISKAYPNTNWSSLVTVVSQKYNGSNAVKVVGNSTRFDSYSSPIVFANGSSSVSYGLWVYSTSSNFRVQLTGLDYNLNQVSWSQTIYPSVINTWTYISINNASFYGGTPNSIKYIAFDFYTGATNESSMSSSDYALIAQPMLVFSSALGSYAPGQYAGQTLSQQGAFSTLNQSVTQLSGFVTDGYGNMGTGLLTALEATTLMQGLDGTKSIMSQTSAAWTVALQNTGAPNLLDNTSDMEDLTGWGGSTTNAVSVVKYAFYANGTRNLFKLSTSGTSEVYLISDRISLTGGATYTVQLKAFHNSAQTSMDIYLLTRSASSTADFDQVQSNKGIIPSTSVINEYTATFTVPADIASGYVRIDNNGSNTSGTGADLYVTEIKLAQELIASPYYPKPITANTFPSILKMTDGTTLIQNNKLYLNANSIVFGGTAWITDAMITSISASHINVGTLNGANVSIINLDANNITANAANFFTTQWQNNYGNRIAINATDIVLTSTTGSNLDIQARKLQFTSSSDSLVINMSTQNWVDQNGTTTTAKGLNFSVLGDTTNSYMSFGRSSGSAVMMYAGGTMDHGANIILNGAWNVFTDFVVTNSKFLRFTTAPSTGSYNIVADAGANSLDFNAVDHFWFNKPIQQNSLLSKKNILGDYPFVAHEELDKMDIKIVNYKDDTEGTKPILTAIIDDVNQVKKYYIPEIMTGHDGVDIYSFASLIALSVKENDLTLADHESRITELENEIKTLKAT